MNDTTTVRTATPRALITYRVDVTPKAGGPTLTRLVRARSRAGAEQHVSDDIITARMATADDGHELAKAGVEIEDAGATES